MDPDYALFVQVVEAGSLSAAARALRISPAMVSKRIARLEARLGVPLLHRTTRKLALTEGGARLHDDLVAILAALREAEARVTGAQGSPRGPLRMTAPTSFGRMHVAPLIPEFLGRYPEVMLELNLSDAFVDLVRERIDVAIRIGEGSGAGVVATRIAGSRRILCAAPSYIARFGAPGSIAELRRHRLLAAEGQLPWRLVTGQRPVTVEGQSHVKTDSSEMVRELAIGGVGVALRSLWDVEAALADGSLKRVLPEVEGSPASVQAVRPRGAIVSPAAQAMVAFLAERFESERWS